MAIQVQQMTAADPGVGFVLSIPSGTANLDLGRDLSVQVVVTEPAITEAPAVAEKSHTFNMTIAQPLVPDDNLVFVLPYCSSTYGRETTVDVSVTVTQGSNNLLTDRQTGIPANTTKKFKLELE